MSSKDDNLAPVRHLPGKEPVEAEVGKDDNTFTSAEIIRVSDGKFHQHPVKDVATPLKTEPESPDSAISVQENAPAPDSKPANAPAPDSKPATQQQKAPPPTPEVKAEPVAPILREQVSRNFAPFVVGGLSGAVMAVFAVFLINKLSPPLDPRMQPMAEQLGTFVERMERHESRLQTVQVDLVGLLEDDTESIKLVNERDARISRALAEVDLVRQDLKAEKGPGSPVFSVAVAQLGNAVTKGESFDAEWVTLFSLTASDPDLRSSLHRLLPLAKSGVDTIETLRADLKTLSLKNGIPNNSTKGGLIHMGTMFLQNQLGIPIGNTPIQQVMGEVMAEADWRLQRRDIGGAILLLGEVGGAYAVALSPWLERAERRQIAVKVSVELRNAAKIRLRERVAKKLATAHTNGRP